MERPTDVIVPGRDDYQEGVEPEYVVVEHFVHGSQVGGAGVWRAARVRVPVTDPLAHVRTPRLSGEALSVVQVAEEEPGLANRAGTGASCNGDPEVLTPVAEQDAAGLDVSAASSDFPADGLDRVASEAHDVAVG